MVKRVGKYEIGHTLGQGTFGKVKIGKHTETGQKVAIKILDKEKIQKQNMGAQIKKEISIMKMVKHDHVVRLFEVMASRSKIFIVLELITGGELFDKIVSESRFTEPVARKYFRQLVRGVQYCHTMGVAHRDLKPENLLLDADGNLKISDFGLSALYTGNSDDNSRATLLHTTCGTPNYVAPEVLNDKGYDGRAADVWSMGVILYVLLAGFLPFDEPIMSALFRKIQKADFVYPKWFTPQARDLLDKILVTNPTTRVTLAQIERHPWMTATDGDDASGSGAGSASSTTAAESKSPDSAGVGAGAGTGAGARASGKGMILTPSQQQMDAAVATVTHSEGKDADDDALPAVTAFHIVNMYGGSDFNYIVRDKHRVPQFITARPAEETVDHIKTHLRELDCTVSDEAATRSHTSTPSSHSHAFAATLVTRTGEVSIHVTIQPLGACNVVTIHRGKGDRLAVHQLRRQLVQRCDDLAIRKR